MKKYTTLCFALAALTLQGCGSTAEYEKNSVVTPRNTIVEKEAMFPVRYYKNGSVINEQDLSRLEKYLDQNGVSSVSQVVIHHGVIAGGETKAGRAIARVDRKIKDELNRHGIKEVAIAYDAGEGAEDKVIVKVVHAALISPDCNKFRKYGEDYYLNIKSRGFGCSNISNLGKMIANPDDMVNGKGETASEADVSVNAFKASKYRSPASQSASGGGSSSGGEGASGGGEAAK